MRAVQSDVVQILPTFFLYRCIEGGEDVIGSSRVSTLDLHESPEIFEMGTVCKVSVEPELSRKVPPPSTKRFKVRIRQIASFDPSVCPTVLIPLLEPEPEPVPSNSNSDKSSCSIM